MAQKNGGANNEGSKPPPPPVQPVIKVEKKPWFTFDFIKALLLLIVGSYVIMKVMGIDPAHELETFQLKGEVSKAQAEAAKKDLELKEQIKFQEYLRICSGEMYFSPQMQAEIRRMTQIYDSNMRLILSQTSADPNNTWTKPRLEQKLRSCEEFGDCSAQDVEVTKYWIGRYTSEEKAVRQAIADVVKNTAAFGLIEFARPQGVDSIARILAKRGIKVELEIRSLNRAIKIEFNPDNPESDFSKRTEFILEALFETWQMKDQYQNPRLGVRFIPNSLEAGGVKTQGRDPFNPDPALRD